MRDDPPPEGLPPTVEPSDESHVEPTGPGAAPILTHRFDGPADSDATDPETTLLLLNGGFMSIAAWEPVATPLAERYRVLRCDFRGQLRTPGPAHRELGANVDDLVALLDHLGLAKVDVLGTSFGGQVGLLLAARRPERVASLVVATVSDRATDAMARQTRELRGLVRELLVGGGGDGADTADRGRFLDALVDDIYSPAWVAESRELLAVRRRQIAALPDAWLAAVDDLLTAVETFDLRDELGRIRCPVLVALATGDRVMPVERGRAVAAAIAGARIVEHSKSGHTVVVEDPEWLVAQTVGFLESLPR